MFLLLEHGSLSILIIILISFLTFFEKQNLEIDIKKVTDIDQSLIGTFWTFGNLGTEFAFTFLLVLLFY